MDLCRTGPLTVARRPPADLVIDEPLVTTLLRRQQPALAALPLHRASSGWDNEIFRLGDRLAVRLPRRRVAARMIVHEQYWLPQLAPGLPLPIPAPVAVGRPEPGVFDRAWSVTPWFEGRLASSLAQSPTEPRWGEIAGQLAAFVTALHRPAPAQAPGNPFRGVPLSTRDRGVRERIAALKLGERVSTRWAQALAAPQWAGPPVWVHADLHPANLILAADGRLAAVIDFSDLTAGDPAVDLAAAWMLLPAEHRPAFFTGVGIGDRTPRAQAMRLRAAGNALAHAVACLAHSDDDPVIGAIGERTLTALLTDWPGQP